MNSSRLKQLGLVECITQDGHSISFLHFVTMWPCSLTFWPNRPINGVRGIVMDYPCAKFGNCSFIRYYRAKLCIARSLLSCGVRSSVRPSVCVCLSRWCIVSKRPNLPSNFFQPIILVFLQETRLWNSDGVTPKGAPNRRGVPKFATCKQYLSVYLGNDAR